MKSGKHDTPRALHYVLERCASVCAERAWRLAMALVRHPEDAADVVQQAFLVAASKPGAVPTDDPWPWFAAVTVNLARNARRKRWRRAAQDAGEENSMDVLPAKTLDPAAAVAAADLADRVRVELDALPEAERDALVLTQLSGLSHAVAASALGMPTGTLSSHVSRGLVRLRQRLGANEPELARSLAASPVAGPACGIAAAVQDWLTAAQGGLASTGAGGAALSIGSAQLTGSIGGIIVAKKHLAAIAAILSIAVGVGVWVAFDRDTDEHPPEARVRNMGAGPHTGAGTGPHSGALPGSTGQPDPRQEQISHAGIPVIGPATGSSESGRPADSETRDARVRHAAPPQPGGPDAEGAHDPVPAREDVSAQGAPRPSVRGCVIPFSRLGGDRFVHGQPVLGLAFSPDARSIVSVGSGGPPRVWDSYSGLSLSSLASGPDVDTGEDIGLMDGCPARASVEFSANGKQVLIVDALNRIRIFDVASGEIVTALPAHPIGSTCAHYVGGGASVVSGGMGEHNQMLWVSDSHTGQLNFPLVGHGANTKFMVMRGGPRLLDTGTVLSAAVSADGAKLITAGSDGNILIWDIASRAVSGTMSVANVAYLALSPSGTVLATAHSRPIAKDGQDAAGRPPAAGEATGTIALWDLATGEQLHLMSHEGASGVEQVAFVPGRTALVSVSRASSMAIAWDTGSGTRLGAFKGPEDGMSVLATSSDGRRLAGAGREGRLVVWDYASGQSPSDPALAEGLPSEPGLGAVAVFMPGHSQVLVGNWDGSVSLWDAALGRAVRQFANPRSNETEGVAALDVSADGATAVVSRFSANGAPRTLDLVDTATGAVRCMLGDPSVPIRGDVMCVGFHPGGELLLALEPGARGIQLWNTLSGSRTRVIAQEDPEQCLAYFIPGGRFILAADTEGYIKLWDIESGQSAATLRAFVREQATVPRPTPPPPGAVRSRREMSPTPGEMSPRKAIFGQAVDGVERAGDTFQRHKARITGLAVNRDGRLAASCDYAGKEIVVWDLDLQREARAFTMPEGRYCKKLVFTDDDIVWSDESGAVTLVSGETGETLANFEGHEQGYQQGLTALAVSRDGRLLVTCSVDRKAFIWKMR